MSLVKISELQDVLSIDPDLDLIPIVDGSLMVTKRCTPRQLSLSGIKLAELYLVEASMDCDASDGIGYFRVPEAYDGKRLISAEACCMTAGTGGIMSIQIYNITKAVNLFLSLLTIESGETDSMTSALPVGIDEDNNLLNTGDQLRIDVTTVHTTPALGLIVTIGMK